MSSYKLISEEEIISWRSGRKICIKNNIGSLKVAKKNECEDTSFNSKDILVFDEKNTIIGVADLFEKFKLKPKVVFNAIG